MGLFDFVRRDATPTPQINFVGFGPGGGLLPGGLSATTALGLSSVWRSLDILANGISQLPWYERRGNLDLPPSRLVNRPQAERTRREWVSLVVSTLALYDTCYLLKVGGEDSEGVPMALWPLPPQLVTPLRTDYATLIPPDTYLINGVETSKDDLVILHRSPQPGIADSTNGVINLARATFAAAVAAENYSSRFWQAGGATQMVLESDANIPDTTAKSISERWTERRAKGPDYAPILPNGLKARSLGVDVSQAAAVEARRELVADIGRYFGVPTNLLNSPRAGDTETYANTESEGLHLVTYTLQNYIDAIEDAISELLPGGRRLFIDPSKLYRGNQLARFQAYQLATGGKPWLTPDDVREMEGLPPSESLAQEAAEPAQVGDEA